MRSALLSIAGALALAAAMWLGSAVTAQESSPVVDVLLPLKLPAVGNLAAVREWKFGRLQEAQMIAGSPDVILRLRSEDGAVHRMIGPAAQLGEMARKSNWMRYDVKSFPTMRDYAERMVAYDVDDNDRLIAMMSLEPIYRDVNRLLRALQ